MENATTIDNFSLLDAMQLKDRPLTERVEFTRDIFEAEYKKQEILYRREVLSSTGPECIVQDPYTGEKRRMLMFGSNNYLGLANHPDILKKVNDYCRATGPGLGAPPLLSGYTRLHGQIEKTLAHLKSKEEAMLFSSGFGANLGLACALFNRKTMVLFDEFSHASFVDGIFMSKARFKAYKHNDMDDLWEKLQSISSANYQDVFVATEGVFSMDGDIGKINAILEMREKIKFWLIVDDAHGLGVIGKNGHGVHEHFQTNGIDIIMGTFSKTMASTGGFIAADHDLIHYLRYMSRTYMFSASLPPVAVAQVMAGFEILENDGSRVMRLRHNCHLADELLNGQGIVHNPVESAIITVIVPETRDIRKIGKAIHNQGIFLNTVEFPAVPKNAERLRISMMCEHSEEDIAQMASCIKAALA